MLFAASAIEHVLDGFHWAFFESLHLVFTLPHKEDVFHGDGFGITKYTILMLLAAVVICGIYFPLASKIRTGEAPTGAFWNLFEAVLTFIRDEVAKPYIGKEADKYVPYLWTVFLFVLTCNLLGMVPFLGSPTASFSMTLVIATGTLLLITIGTIVRHGIVAFVFSFAPHMEMPLALKIPMIMMLWPIEVIGLLIKCFVLSVRLFANMFAGHMVLATILLFIPAVANTNPALEWGVTFASVFGVLALSLLELFVAFLQAFLFTFLTALFLGGVLEHAEHAVGGHHDHEHGHGLVDPNHPPGEILPTDAGEEDVHLKKTGH
jgi:F-type H+-transporting ATPase subunit a